MTQTSPTPSKTKAKAPAPVKSHFSIEAAEREWNEEEKPETFVVDLGGGDTARLRSVQELGWKVAASLSREEPFLFLRTVVHEDDYTKFSGVDFPLEVMNRLVAAWQNHYGVDPEGN